MLYGFLLSVGPNLSIDDEEPTTLPLGTLHPLFQQGGLYCVDASSVDIFDYDADDYVSLLTIPDTEERSIPCISGKLIESTYYFKLE